MSLRLRTVFGIGLIQCLLLVILGYSSVQGLRDTLADQLQLHVNTTQSLAKGVLVEPLLSADLATIDTILAELTLADEVVYAGVMIDQRWVSFSGEPIEKDISPDLGLETVEDGIFDSYELLKNTGFGEAHLAVGFSTDDIDRQVTQSIYSFTLLAALGLLLSGGFSFYLGAWLSARANRLTKAAARLGRGDLNTVVVDTGNDEFSELAKQFNGMAERLRSEASNARRHCSRPDPKKPI